MIFSDDGEGVKTLGGDKKPYLIPDRRQVVAEGAPRRSTPLLFVVRPRRGLLVFDRVGKFLLGNKSECPSSLYFILPAGKPFDVSF